MAEVYRTPDERFADLPDFDYEPHYREVDGLRLAHLDEGDGPPVVFLHGEPTWSFLWRHVFPPVRDAGFRCVIPDLPGFGRSDKPTDDSWYSYDRHTEAVARLLEDLDLRDVTMVVHDWGGPIGLRVSVEHPDRVSRMVLMDTGVFTGRQPMTDAWHQFKDYVVRTPDVPTGFLVRLGCATDPGDEVAAAYEGRGTTDRLDGLTVDLGDWWFNLRPSNTEPLLRLNAEAADRATMEAIRDEVLGLVRVRPGKS